KTMGILPRRSLSPSFAATSPPSRPGIITSSRIRSGINWSAAATAVELEFSVRTSKREVASRFRLTMRVIDPSLSTIRFFFFMRAPLCDWKGDYHHRAAGVFPVVDCNIPPVHLNDISRNGQSQACSRADRLRREEGFEKLIDFIFRNSGARVFDFY